MLIGGCRGVQNMDNLLKAKIDSIKSMGRFELNEFKKNVSLSEINNKTKFYIYQAIEGREIKLNKEESAEVTNGEVKDGECA